MEETEAGKCGEVQGGQVRTVGGGEQDSSSALPGLSSSATDQQDRRFSQSESSTGSTTASRSEPSSRTRGTLFPSSFSFARLASAVSALHRVAASELSIYKESLRRSSRQSNPSVTDQPTPQDSLHNAHSQNERSAEEPSGRAEHSEFVAVAGPERVTAAGARAEVSGRECHASDSARESEPASFEGKKESSGETSVQGHTSLQHLDRPLGFATCSDLEAILQDGIAKEKSVAEQRPVDVGGGRHVFLPPRSCADNIQEFPCLLPPSEPQAERATSTDDCSSCSSSVHQARSSTSQTEREGEQLTSVRSTSLGRERKSRQGTEGEEEVEEVRKKSRGTGSSEGSVQSGVVDDPRVDDFDMHGALVFDDYLLLNYPSSPPPLTTFPVSLYGFTRRSSSVQKTTPQQGPCTSGGGGGGRSSVREPRRKEKPEKQEEEEQEEEVPPEGGDNRSSRGRTEEDQGVLGQSGEAASARTAHDEGGGDSPFKDEEGGVQTEGRVAADEPSDFPSSSSCPVSDSSEPLLCLASSRSGGNLRGSALRSSASSTSSFDPLRHIEELRKSLRGAVDAAGAFDVSGGKRHLRTGIKLGYMRWHPLITRCVFGPLVQEKMFSRWKDSGEASDAVVVVKLSDYVVRLEGGRVADGHGETEAGTAHVGVAKAGGARREEGRRTGTGREVKNAEEEEETASVASSERVKSGGPEDGFDIQQHQNSVGENTDGSSDLAEERLPSQALDVRALEMNVTLLFKQRPQAVVMLNDLPLSCRALVFPRQDDASSVGLSSSREGSHCQVRGQDDTATTMGRPSSISRTRSDSNQQASPSSSDPSAIAGSSPSSFFKQTRCGASERSDGALTHPSGAAPSPAEARLTDTGASSSSRGREGAERRTLPALVPFTPGVFTSSFLGTIASSSSFPSGEEGERSASPTQGRSSAGRGEGAADSRAMVGTSAETAHEESFGRSFETITTQASAAAEAAEAGKKLLSDLVVGTLAEDDEDSDGADGEGEEKSREEWLDMRKENVPVVILVMRGGTDLAKLSEVEGIRRACITPVPLRIGDHVYRTIKPRGIL